MTFVEFVAFAAAYPLDSLDDTFVPYAMTMQAKRGCELASKRCRSSGYPQIDSSGIQVYSERNFFGSFLVNILHPYSVLRLLAEIEANKDAPVVWLDGPLVQAGWATERSLCPTPGEPRRS